jgi:hypothetical protein
VTNLNAIATVRTRGNDKESLIGAGDGNRTRVLSLLRHRKGSKPCGVWELRSDQDPATLTRHLGSTEFGWTTPFRSKQHLLCVSNAPIDRAGHVKGMQDHHFTTCPGCDAVLSLGDLAEWHGDSLSTWYKRSSLGYPAFPLRLKSRRVAVTCRSAKSWLHEQEEVSL